MLKSFFIIFLDITMKLQYKKFFTKKLNNKKQNKINVFYKKTKKTYL